MVSYRLLEGGELYQRILE
jgi:calcium-dependent protein kinase